MAFIFNHKIFTLFVLLCIAYWYFNPPKKFGIVNKWLIVYNRIPVTGIGFFVSPTGNFFLEYNVSDKQSLKYWYDNHLNKPPVGSKQILLFVGTGFEHSNFSLDKSILPQLQSQKVYVRQALTPDAIHMYNAAIDSGIPAAILIKN
jgi:hypothetical protein